MSTEEVPVKKSGFSPTLIKGILALLLRDEEFQEHYFPILKPENFYSDDKLIFTIAKAIWELYDKYGKFPTDDILIEEVFVQKGKNIGLFSHVPTEEETEALKEVFASLYEYDISNRKYFEDNTIRILGHLALVKVISDNRDQFKSGDLDIDSFAQQVQDATTFAKPVILGKNLLDDLEDRTEDRIKNPIIEGSVSLVIPSLSNHLEDGAIPPGSFCFWLAPTNGGKSCALICSAYNAAFYDKLNVLYIAAELTEDTVKKRFDSCITKIPINFIRKEAEKVKQLYLQSPTFQSIAKRIRVVEVPIGNTSVADIDNMITRLEKKEEIKFGVIVVDYADNLKATKKTDAYRHEVASVYKDLVELARSRKVVVWTASQMNDQGTIEAEKENGALSIRHTNESRQKIHLAHLVIGIARTQKEKDTGIARLVLVKNRLGSGDGHTIRVFPDFARSILFTGKEEELDKVDLEQPIEGLDKNVAEQDEFERYRSDVD